MFYKYTESIKVYRSVFATIVTFDFMTFDFRLYDFPTFDLLIDEI